MNISDWEPFDSYDLVDLGCGTVPKNIISAAKNHPDKKFLGIDRQLILGVILAAKPLENLDLLKADCTEALQKMPNQSILEANADFFLNLPNKRWEENKSELLKALKKKLVFGGMLYVSDMSCNIEKIKELLNSLGYATSKNKRVEDMQIPLTPSMQIATSAREMARGKKIKSTKRLYGVTLQDLANKHKENPDDLTPVLFVATI